MTREKIIIVILLIVVVGSIVGLRTIPQTENINNAELLQPGDILFVDIYDGWSFWGRWDHMAIYVGEQIISGVYRDRAVVEATFDAGVTLTQVDAFLERDRPAEVSVKRLKDIPEREKIIREAVEYALNQEGKRFDVNVFISPLFHKIGDKAYHCAEVIWRAYKQAGVDLDSNSGFMLLPDDTYFSSWLESI
jgi:uncharacterized protein YycO